MTLSKMFNKVSLAVLFMFILLSTSLMAQFPEGFESGAIPAAWTVYNVDGDTKQFTATNAGANAYEGTWVAAVGWNANGCNDWLVSPQINVTNTQKVVRLYARSTSASFLEDFNIKLSTTGNAVADFTVTLGSYTQIPNAWNEYIVDLSNYIGNTVYLAVQCVSVDELTFHVDGFDWVLGDDLAALSISGPNTPTVNTANDYIVTVKNNGGNTQNNYTVKLYVNDTEYQTQTGTTIAPGATAQHTFSWTPTAVQNYTLKGKVILTGDSNPANDETSPLIVTVQPAGTAAVTIGNPNSTTTSYSYPINYFYKSSISQTLYMQDELNIGGAITMFKYYANLDGAITGQKPLKVWMANTAQTEFASTSDWLPLSEFTLVFDGTIDFTGLSGEVELSIPLATPFAYAGGNLCLMVNRPLDGQYYSTSNKFKTTATANYPNRLMYVNSDTVEYNPSALPTGTRVGIVPNTTFMLMTGGLAELTGTVTCNGNPVAGALVEVDNTTRSALTNADGEYTIPYLNPGTVNITTSKLGYIDTHTTGIVLVADETTTQNIVIEQLPYVEISGVVKNGTNGQVISGATVRLTGYENYEVTSEADGSFTIDEVYTNHDYTLSVLKGGFVVYTDEVEVGTNDIDLGDIELETNPALVELLVGDPNTTTEANQYPMNFYWKSSLTQAIYMENELNVEYCLGDQAAITSIKYYANLNGDIPAGKPIKIWMANTEQTAFEGTAGWVPYDNFTLVFDGTLDLNLSGAQTVNIDLDVPFAYDGGNLVIMVYRPLDSAYYNSLNKWKYTATPTLTNRTIYYMSDSADPDPNNPPATSTAVSNVPNTGFSFSTAGFASLNGVVTSAGTPVEGVKVAVDGTTRYTMTNAQGQYNMNLLIPGTVNLTATKFGYIDAHETGVVLTADETTVKNITINPVPTVTVSGQVNASDTSAGLAGATVKLTGYEDYEVESNASGAFTIPGVYANNTYTLKITAPGYQAHTQELAVAAANVTVPAITLNELANPPSGVVATPSPTQVDITWNAPGDGVDVWFSHTSLDTFSDAIGTGGAAQFEVAHRYSPAHLETYGVAGATLEKVQFMPHEPTATYGIKIYTGTAGSGPGPLAYTQAVSSVVVDEWNEVELGESVQIPSDTDLWIAIDINTPTGYPAGCDDGPAILGYGDMMYFQGAWSTLDDLAGIDANWMIKGFATGAAGPREFAISTGAHTPSETAYLATRNSQPAPFAKASANGEVVTRTNAPTENKPVFTQTANTRAITGYNVWRTPLATMNNESTWTQLATGLTATQYTDETWAQVPTGEFKYVVKALYTGGVASNPAFSNTIFKNMTATVNISLATADGGSPAGAIVTLTNTDGNPDHTYTQTAASANVIFPQVWHGIYTITVAKVGYQTVIQENVIIAGESYTHPTITLPVSSIILTEGFEGTFPPTGWTIIDSDGDGHNWMQWDYTPHGGVYGVASGSYDNNIGQLFPDNWLITSQISLAPNTTNTLKFWVSPQDPSYPQDHYSVMVSTTNAQPASFTSIYTETIMGSTWEERTVNLPYAGQNIYVAFRHHDCTDWYIMKIDDIEIAGSEATGENVPSVLQTALVGNYPNPFNPTTTISYNLANDSHVSIDIYNVKGQKVKTLVNDRVTAGTHNVVWNGKDDSGKNVGSGIYFFNMKAGKYTSTRKMILMK